MKNKTKKNALYLIVCFLLCTFPAQADGFGDIDEDEDSEDALLDPAPIDDYIIPMLIMGISTAIYLINRNEKKLLAKK